MKNAAAVYPGSHVGRSGRSEPRECLTITLQGRVQGVGVRPAIARLANELGLAGAVANRVEGVVVQVEGTTSSIRHFEQTLPQRLPKEAHLESMRAIPSAASHREGFLIVLDHDEGPLTTQVAPDRAACADCLVETREPTNRRYRYPFTSCTVCGPRYTLVERMPYERPHTSMEGFQECKNCRREREDLRDRRGHSQINACPTCGPQVWWSEGNPSERVEGEAALQQAVAVLREGRILALRGLGGYQLLVDATSATAVERLRRRKRRPAKPLAVLVDSIATARKLAKVSEAERETLEDASNPIVILTAATENGLATNISPGLSTVGLLLPTTPLHDLLVRDVGRPLVCTSGNADGEPLAYAIDDAEKRLATVCDAWLHHNREIAHPVDDSVVRVIADRRVTVRLARGLAPLALPLESPAPQLAVGGHMKCATAWSNGSQAVLGPHLGDQETLSARQRFAEHDADMRSLYGAEPERIVHDMHPDYATTSWASRQQAPTVSVQHHHAHVVAGMLEHGWLDRQVLGVAWDGSGWGPDGAVWGGEFLLATVRNFERVAHFRPFALPGGETAIREPWRVLLAIAAQIDAVDTIEKLGLLPADRQGVQNTMAVIEHPGIAPITTSAGRLFDAAAAIALGVSQADYEGELAMRLESAADPTATGAYTIPLRPGCPLELDWRPMFQQMLAERAKETPPGVISIRFHRALAHAIVSVCRRFPTVPTLVTGGVFQNRLLTELLVEAWGDSPRALGLPGAIPPNDGGLAAGQLAIACHTPVVSEDKESPPCA